jgi:RNA recognition motif-containing protein
MYVLGRGEGGYSFRRSNDNNDEDEIEILKDAIFIQNLPRTITRDDIQDAFSTVGPIKVGNKISLMIASSIDIGRPTNDRVVLKFGFTKIV